MSLFFRQLRHLLPRAEAWKTAADKTLRKYLIGVANSWTPIRTYIDLVWVDLFPDTTRELEQFEHQFGIIATGNDASRRQVLDAAWKATGGQDPHYLQTILQTAGFSVYVHEWWASGPPFIARDPRTYVLPPLIGTAQCMTGFDEYGAPVPGQPECSSGLDALGDPLLQNHWIGSGGNADFTATDSGNLITSAGHGRSNGDRVGLFDTQGSLPGGVDHQRAYYVINATKDTFQISETLDGSAVNITADGSGKWRAGVKVKQYECNDFLVNDPGYLVNLDLSPRAPPPVPDDPSFWPYFIYVGAATFGTRVYVDPDLLDQLKRLILKHFPDQHWVVLLTTDNPAGPSTTPFQFDAGDGWNVDGWEDY